MAQIREYSAPSGEELRPSDLGENSLVKAARNIEVQGSAAADAVKQGGAEIGRGIARYGELADKHATFQEISQGAASFAQLRNATDAVANQAFKDPNQNTDPDLQNKITQQVSPMIDQWLGNFKSDGGQRWAMEQAAGYREHFANRLAADTSTMSGIAAEGHLNDWLKNSSEIVERDPTAIAQERNMVMPTIDALISNLPGMSAADAAKFRTEHSAKMLQQLDTVGLNKLALTNPGAARSQYDAGAFPNADPIHAEQIIKMGDSVARQNAASDRAVREFNEHEANERAVSNTVGTIGQLTKAAQTGDPAALQKLKDFQTQILIDGPKNGMKGTSAWEAHNMIQSTLMGLGKKDDTISNPAALGDINTRMLAPGGPDITASDIVQSHLKGDISDADMRDRVSMLNVMKNDPAVSTPMKAFQEEVTKFEPLIKGAGASTSAIPNLGDYRSHEFLNDHLQAFQQGLQQGLKATDMLTPSSKDYIFKDLKDYMVTPDQETTVFGKQFTLDDAGAPTVPTAVRVMEAFRQQQQTKRQRQMDEDATAVPQSPTSRRAGPDLNMPGMIP